MSDLISRQAAMDALAKFVPYVIDDISTESYTNGLTDAYNMICQLPPAQPERKTGRWIQDKHEIDGYGYFDCSECGADFYDVDGFKYCPNCGARMEVDK